MHKERSKEHPVRIELSISLLTHYYKPDLQL